MRVALILILLLVSLSARSSVSNSTCRAIDGAMCSKAFAADGRIDAKDTVAIIETPWESRPIAITGVGIAFDITRPWYRFLSPIKCAAFAGDSYQPDVMLWQDGTGSTTRMFGAAGFFPLPAASEPDPPHVDLHVFCNERVEFSARLIVYYRLR